MFNNEKQLIELKKLHSYGLDKISFEDAIKKVNDSCYGLAAGIITENKNLYKENITIKSKN